MQTLQPLPHHRSEPGWWGLWDKTKIRVFSHWARSGAVPDCCNDDDVVPHWLTFMHYLDIFEGKKNLKYFLASLEILLLIASKCHQGDSFPITYKYISTVVDVQLICKIEDLLQKKSRNDSKGFLGTYFGPRKKVLEICYSPLVHFLMKPSAFRKEPEGHEQDFYRGILRDSQRFFLENSKTWKKNVSKSTWNQKNKHKIKSEKNSNFES